MTKIKLCLTTTIYKVIELNENESVLKHIQELEDEPIGMHCDKIEVVQ